MVFCEVGTSLCSLLIMVVIMESLARDILLCHSAIYSLKGLLALGFCVRSVVVMLVVAAVVAVVVVAAVVAVMVGWRGVCVCLGGVGSKGDPWYGWQQSEVVMLVVVAAVMAVLVVAAVMAVMVGWRVPGCCW